MPTGKKIAAAVDAKKNASLFPIDKTTPLNYNDFIVNDYGVNEMPNKRSIQKEQTRAALIEASYQLFCKNGIMNTRMGDIAAAAKVSHGTVFAHFETQEALISEVIEVYGGKIALSTHTLSGCCQRLEQLLAAHLKSIGEYEPFYRQLVIENRLLPRAARDVWVSIQSAVSFHFSQVVEREKEAGLHLDIPTYMLFNIWVGLIHYYLMNDDLFSPKGNVIEAYRDILIESYMKLIKKEGTR